LRGKTPGKKKAEKFRGRKTTEKVLTSRDHHFLGREEEKAEERKEDKELSVVERGAQV